MKPPVYFWIDHTTSVDVNSGIQRLVRALGRALEVAGRDVVYVRWSRGHLAPVRAGRGDMEQLSRHGGSDARTQASAGKLLHANDTDRGRLEGAWLIVPEVTQSLQQRQLWADAIDYARSQGMKTVFVFYDLIPLIVPGYDDNLDTHQAYSEQLALADLVLPISEYAGDTLRVFFETLKIPQAEWPEIHAVLLAETLGSGARPAFAPPSGDIQILSLGTVEPRKNQLHLLRAFNRLSIRRPELRLKLHVVGDVHPGVADEFERLCAANPFVRYHGYLSDARTEKLYCECAFTVYPSVEEGYGLPIVESLWFGRPCICADFGAMGEVAAGGGCHVIDTKSEAALEQAIEKLATDTGYRVELVRAALKRPFKKWDQYAAEVEDRLAGFEAGSAPKLAARGLPSLAPVPLSALQRPLLSVWLQTPESASPVQGLRRLLEIVEPYRDVVEIVWCDFSAGPGPADRVREFLSEKKIAGVKFPGAQLGEAMTAVSGEFVWLVGEGEPPNGALEDLLEALVDHPGAGVVLLDKASQDARFAERLGELVYGDGELLDRSGYILRRNHAARVLASMAPGIWDHRAAAKAYALRMLLDRPAVVLPRKAGS